MPHAGSTCTGRVTRRSPRIEQVFSGDVWADVSVPDTADPITAMILQHPCWIHQDVYLRDELLVAEVVPQTSPILPSKWRNGCARHFPLHLLRGNDHAVARYDLFHTVKKDALQAGRRIACLTQYGVSLMMQRWVYYNTRVIVPHSGFHGDDGPPVRGNRHDEEDGANSGRTTVSAPRFTREIADFLNEKPDDKISRRDQLKDPSSEVMFAQHLQPDAGNSSDTEHLQYDRQRATGHDTQLGSWFKIKPGASVAGLLLPNLTDDK